MDLEMLQERARIIRAIRSFFDDRDYLELDTPLLTPDLIPESCLEVFETQRILPNNKAAGSTDPYWLIPSPEIWMKKIIARHCVNVYQICKCFRNGESSGFLHSPEFTMLEYYTMDADYMDSLRITEELFAFLGSRESGVGSRDGSLKAGGTSELSHNTSNNYPTPGLHPNISNNNPDSLSSPDSPSSPLFFERLTVAEAFARYAGFDLFDAAENGGMETEARRLGLEPPPGMETAALYDLIFIHSVEPKLKDRRFIALLDYPAFVPCLARLNTSGKNAGKCRERWELYCNGIELANCYSEETNAQQVREFFESEAAAKEQQALVKHRVDNNYWKIFGTGDARFPKGEASFPRCSGVALGIDRLIMVLCGRSTIDSVLPFA